MCTGNSGGAKFYVFLVDFILLQLASARPDICIVSTCFVQSASVAFAGFLWCSKLVSGGLQ